MFPGSASDTEWVDAYNNLFEVNDLTDFQPFRLFFEGVTNEYKPVGIACWLRNMSTSMSTWYCIGVSKGNMIGKSASNTAGVISR